MKPNKFKCAKCLETYEREGTYDEALEEFESTECFKNVNLEDTVSVCTNCYEMLISQGLIK